MNKNEIWQQIKNDTTTVYNEPIFDVFLKTTDNIHKDHYANLTLDQKKLVKPLLRLSIAAWTFRKEELEVIDNAFKDAGDSPEITQTAIRMIKDATNNGNMDLLNYLLTNPKIRNYFVGKSNSLYEKLTNEQMQKIGFERIINNILRAAIVENKLEVIKHLVEKDYLNYLNDIYFLNAFADSIRNGWINIVKYLFNEFIVKKPNIKEKINEHPEIATALIFSASMTKFDVIKFLLENGIFDTKTLPKIAKEGELELVKMMIEKMNLKKPEQQNSLNDAFVKAAAGPSGGGSNIDMVKYLAEIIKKTTKPAYLSSHKGALIQAVIHGNVESTKYIIDNFDVDINDIKKAISHVDLRSSTGQKIRDYLNEKYKELST